MSAEGDGYKGAYEAESVSRANSIQQQSSATARKKSWEPRELTWPRPLVVAKKLLNGFIAEVVGALIAQWRRASQT